MDRPLRLFPGAKTSQIGAMVMVDESEWRTQGKKGRQKEKSARQSVITANHYSLTQSFIHRDQQRPHHTPNQFRDAPAPRQNYQPKFQPQPLNLASTQIYPELRAKGQVWHQKSVHPFIMYNLPSEILAHIASFFWTPESDSELSFIDQSLNSEKVICMMLKLGLCSTSLFRFVSKKYSKELGAINKSLVLNFIQKLRNLNIDMENDFDGYIDYHSRIYRQIRSLEPRISLELVFTYLKSNLLTVIDYHDLLSKLWLLSCVYDPPMTSLLVRSLSSKSTKDVVTSKSKSKSLNTKHFCNGFKLSICAGQCHVADYLLRQQLVRYTDKDTIIDGLCSSVRSLLDDNLTCQKISAFIAESAPEDFLCNKTIKKFFDCCTWTEKKHIEKLHIVIKELGVPRIFRLGKSVDDHIYSFAYNHFVRIVKSAVKFDCIGLLQLIVEGIEKLLTISELDQDILSNLTFDVYNAQQEHGESKFDLNTQQLFLLSTIIKEGITYACKKGKSYVFKILCPEKMLVEDDLYTCWKAIRNGSVYQNQIEEKKSDLVKLILHLFSLTKKITYVNFTTAMSTSLMNFIFGAMCYSSETMSVLLDLPCVDISFNNFGLIKKAVGLSEKKIIERIFRSKNPQLDRFFTTINYDFFNKFKYSGEKTDLEIFRMILLDSRMRLITYLEQQFTKIYVLEKAVPYTLTIIQAPHLRFELYFGEFISHVSLEAAPKEVIVALQNHKKIRQMYNFEFMKKNLSSNSNRFIRENLDILIGM